MTDRPIIFSAPMVRALLEGHKTQTRRLAWQPRVTIQVGDGPAEPIMVESLWQRVQPADRLWVRESVRYDWARAGGAWILPADDAGLLGVRGRTLETPTPHRWPTGSCPSIHMPRWASRLTLTVTDVRRQRLQDITREDCLAEGMVEQEIVWGAGAAHERGRQDARLLFIGIWESLHGAESWAADPEVVALTFTVARRNIDAALAGNGHRSEV